MTQPQPVFTVSGSTAQQQIVRDALAACDFPWERLLPGLAEQTRRTSIPVEWADLSRFADTPPSATAHPLRADGGGGTLGLFWYDGRIQIERSLVSRPSLAAEVFLAEAAHAVDVFYATDPERAAIAAAWHPAGPDGHGWFDSGAYETWMGEAFMGAFIRAFAPSVPVTLTQFTHPATPEIAAVVRRILLREPVAPPAPPAPPEFPLEQVLPWLARPRSWNASRRAADAVRAWLAAGGAA